MMLRELIADADLDAAGGDLTVDVTSLAYDSRAVAPGCLFFCVPGEHRDGHEFAAQAVDAGAVGLVVERSLGLSVAELQVRDARAAMAPLAARFFGEPSAQLQVAGITGTNGKTTTAFLLREILETAGRRCGLLGTVKQIVGGREESVVRTTPEAIDLQGALRRMLDAGDVACAMEVSSHALALHRADSIHFDVAVFTNLTPEHLDFHADMDDYFAAKRALFPAAGARVINIDDRYGVLLAQEFSARTFSAAGADADFRATEVSFDAAGSRFVAHGPDGSAELRTALPGHFNVANALAALAAAHALGIPTAEAARAVCGANRVPGRLEPIEEGQGFGVLIDYAHTPDSLANVLGAARRLTEERLISVFGAGGDRDRAKRPEMGRIATELSDLAIITSDNPRSEQPEAIIEEILAGADRSRAQVEPDRRKAIALALSDARAGDMVVIAGKGHEQGQEFGGGQRVPFDDREVAREELRRLSGRGG